MVPKKEGSFRPILDLKHVNWALWVLRIHMETLQSIMVAVQKSKYLTAVDLKKAYLHIPIWPVHQRFLFFATSLGHFQFWALPFSLANAPRTFYQGHGGGGFKIAGYSGASLPGRLADMSKIIRRELGSDGESDGLPAKSWLGHLWTQEQVESI